MSDQGYNLSRKVRKPRQKNQGNEMTYPIYGNRKNVFATEDPQGRLTFSGMYNLLLVEMQRRGWQENTCKKYDRVVNIWIEPEFKDRAFEEIDDYDLFIAWENILKKAPSVDVTNVCYVNLRLIMEIAYDKGLTCTSLWGVAGSILPQVYTGNESEEERNEKEGKRLANFKLYKRLTIPLETEIRMCAIMLERYEEDGRLLGGLLMNLGDGRTSEITACNYSALQEVRPGCWGLVIRETSDHDSVETSEEGKSLNFFRILYIPNFLALRCKKRQKMLEEIYGDVGDFPIACVGRDYKRRCTQRELNAALKEIYRESGVDEALVLLACQILRDDPELCELCDRSPTAYLNRHQAITEFIACGLSPGEIYYIAGHKMEDPYVKKSDFSNPDCYERMAKKLSRRPLVQYFERAEKYQTISVQGGPENVQQIQMDGSLKIEFERDGDFLLEIGSKQRHSPMDIELEGVDIQGFLSIPQKQERAPESISLRTPFYYYAMEQGEKALPQEKNEVTMAVPAMSIPGFIEKLARGEMVRQSTLVNGIPANEFMRATQNGGYQAAVRPAPRMSKAPRYAQSDAMIYLVDDEEKLLQIENCRQIARCGRTGEKLIDGGHQVRRVERVITHRPEWETFVLDTTGRIYYMPAGTSLETLAAETGGQDCDLLAALKRGGILLQRNPAGDREGACIVCLGNRGGIRRISMSGLRKIPPGGKQMIKWKEDSQIVAACICDRVDDDILIVTRRGKGLRLGGGELRSVKSGEAYLIQGITLDETDEPVACLPYRKNEDYLVIKAFGKIARIENKNQELRASGRGGKGVNFVFVSDHDQVAAVVPLHAAVLIMKGDGYGLCIDASQIPAYRRGAAGVRAIQIKDGKTVVGMSGLDFADAPERKDLKEN